MNLMIIILVITILLLLLVIMLILKLSTAKEILLFSVGYRAGAAQAAPTALLPIAGYYEA